MAFKSRLDELENLYEHGGLYATEVIELWVRRNPALYAFLAVIVTAVLVL